MDVDPVPTSSAQTEQTEDPPEPRVLKSIRKTEVELLCHQHNPVRIASINLTSSCWLKNIQATLAKKKEVNEKRIRDRVTSIPEGSLIKLRITNGIFEVQLLRIVEERRTVEVLWDADKDLKKEFSWKSVLVGNTEGIVAQKPSDVAPRPSRECLVLYPNRRGILSDLSYHSSCTCCNATSSYCSQHIVPYASLSLPFRGAVYCDIFWTPCPSTDSFYLSPGSSTYVYFLLPTAPNSDLLVRVLAVSLLRFATHLRIRLRSAISIRRTDVPSASLQSVSVLKHRSSSTLPTLPAVCGL